MSKTKLTNQNILRYYQRLNNDVNGNPRYKISARDLADLCKFDYNNSETSYADMVKRVRKVGGGKLNTRYHPYSIKVTSYSIVDTHNALKKALN
jgi:hypothetical protein